MAPFLEVAMQRFPALEDAGIRTLFCGPESFTDDLSPMLGESPEVDGLYLACGLNSVGILSGGGLGHMMAQWLIEEHPPLDVTAVGVDRAHEFQATRRFREERTVSGWASCSTTCPGRTPRTSTRATYAGRRTTPSTSPTAPTSSPPAGGSTPTTSPARRHPDRRVGLRARRGVRAHP
jgi:4-methylaminobutanoate oxidase (formaldehyde-forming)